MYLKIIFLALILLVAASHAQAGVIASDLGAGGGFAMCDDSAAPPEEDPSWGFLVLPCSGMSGETCGNVRSSICSPLASAFATLCVPDLENCHRLLLCNERLPQSPVLDGLLKPA